MKNALFCMIVILISSSAFGAVINVPGEQPTIQLGIDTAVNGDTVLIADGTYIGSGNKNINFQGKSITVMSENGPINCVLDCENDQGGAVFNSNEGNDSILQGLTLTRGSTVGIFCSFSSPTIQDCILSENNDLNYGGGIFLENCSSVIIRNCSILNNIKETGSKGGGINAIDSSFQVENSLISENIASRGGGIYAYNSEFTVDSSDIQNNSASMGYAHQGGGIYFERSYAKIINCNISNNFATLGGGGICCSYYDGSSSAIITDSIISGNEGSSGGGILLDSGNIILINCILKDNVSSNGGGIYGAGEVTSIILENCTLAGNNATESGGAIWCYALSAILEDCIVWNNIPNGITVWEGDAYNPLLINYSDIQLSEGVWPGVGNINADPLFIPGPVGAFYLSQTESGQSVDSPCLDTGSRQAAGSFLPLLQGMTTLAGRSTRTDTVGDQDTVDMGYHFFAGDVPSHMPQTAIFQTSYPEEPIMDARRLIINIPADYPNIQAGIDAAIDGDTVLVANGTYSGEGNYCIHASGKAITIMSENGPQGCKIEFLDSSPGLCKSLFFIHEGEGLDTVIRGFTLSGGQGFPVPYSSIAGGGIYCLGASFTIIDCIITDCSADHGNYPGLGGGIALYYSSSRIFNCTFTNNSSGIGAGISCDNSAVLIHNCTIKNNPAIESDTSSSIYCRNSSVILRNCEITGNEITHGATIKSRNVSLIMENCTFSDNILPPAAAGIDSELSGIIIVNSILWNESGNEISESSSPIVMNYCNIEGGHPGQGIIDATPLFVAGPWGKYYLSQIEAGQSMDSPCVEGGFTQSDDISFYLPAGRIYLSELCTRTDMGPDSNLIDLGYHYPVEPPPLPSMSFIGFIFLIILMGIFLKQN